MTWQGMNKAIRKGQDEALHEEIEALIKRMQKIQRGIRGSGEPASRFEIDELRELGQRYAQLVDRLETE